MNTKVWDQQTITLWGIVTFGHASGGAREIAIRCNKEVAELLVSCYNVDDKIISECADVLIVLLQACEYLDHDLLGQTILYEKHKFSASMLMNLALRINSYMADFISSLENDKKEKARINANAILTVLYSMESMVKFDLLSEVQKKMEINSKRKWGKADDGSFQHV